MTDFWSKVAAEAQPAPQQAPAAAQPWWAPNVPPQVVQQPQAAPHLLQRVPQISQAIMAPDQQYNIEILLQQENYTTNKAQSANVSSRCPSCNGNNYMSPPGSPNAAPRCFECGQNPRFMHSTQGVSPTTTTGSPRVSRGQNNAPAGSPPMMSVIGHV